MESQPQNPEFRINPENFHPCLAPTMMYLVDPGPNFGLSLHLHASFVYESGKGTGETAQLVWLFWAFIACQCNKYQNLMCLPIY